MIIHRAIVCEKVIIGFIVSLVIAATIPVKIAQAKYANCSGGYVGITYDDGPTPPTPAYLKKLKQYGVRATFSILALKSNNTQDMLGQRWAMGML